MLYVLRMISEPDEIAATRQVHQLKPGLVRHCQKKLPVGQRHQALECSSRIEEMLEHFECDRHVEANVVELLVEQIGAQEAFCRPARACLGERVGAQVKTLITLKLDTAGCQFINDEAFAATEIENALRRQRAELVSQRVVKPSET